MFNLEGFSQFTRFCAVGGSVASIDLTSVWITSHFLPALVAVSFGYIAGATCHFLLNKFWVFRCNGRRHRHQLALYLLHVAIYWFMSMVIVSLVLSTTAASVVVARVISIPPMMLFTFCSLRFVVFSKARVSPSLLQREACGGLSDER